MKTTIHFDHISLGIFLIMRNVSDKSGRENQNQNTNFMLSNFFSENRAVYEIK
jgi:hypothetical protein